MNEKADKKGLLETERRLRKPEWECCFSLLPFCFGFFFMMSLEPPVFQLLWLPFVFYVSLMLRNASC